MSLTSSMSVRDMQIRRLVWLWWISAGLFIGALTGWVSGSARNPAIMLGVVVSILAIERHATVLIARTHLCSLDERTKHFFLGALWYPCLLALISRHVGAAMITNAWLLVVVLLAASSIVAIVWSINSTVLSKHTWWRGIRYSAGAGVLATFMGAVIWLLDSVLPFTMVSILSGAISGAITGATVQWIIHRLYTNPFVDINIQHNKQYRTQWLATHWAARVGKYALSTVVLFGLMVLIAAVERGDFGQTTDQDMFILNSLLRIGIGIGVLRIGWWLRDRQRG